MAGALRPVASEMARLCCGHTFCGDADVTSASPDYHDVNGCFYCAAGSWAEENNDKLACRPCPPGTYGLVRGATNWQSSTDWDGTALDPGCLPVRARDGARVRPSLH